MGNDRDGIAGTFDIIESHLRAKGHSVRRDDSGDGLHIGCAGVMIDRPAGCGTFVTTTTSRAQETVLAALSDLDIEGEHAEEIDEVRSKLAHAVPVLSGRRDSGFSYIDAMDCGGCELTPCDVVDVLGDCHPGHCDLGHCDAGGCDVPGCDLC